ncbi:MAG: DUF4294 domain-containing protein [Bacteroidota bacterium]
MSKNLNIPSILQLSVVIIFTLVSSLSLAQDSLSVNELIDGDILKGFVSDGDTLMFSTLAEASISTARLFETEEDRKYYRLTKRRANKVYPYAVKALEVFKKIETYSKDAKKRQRKKYIKSLQKELKTEFEIPLRNLSKSQGRILVEMIERELDTSMFKLIKELKGGFKANTWTFAGKFYGYRLKQTYDPTEDEILEYVLTKFDLSHVGQ